MHIMNKRVSKSVKRVWEIDFLRGIAIIMMIIFHLLFDLSFFSAYAVDVYSGFWWLFARITAAIFILLVGISLTLSYSRIKNKVTKQIHIKYIVRGLKIFSWGLIITAITWLYLSQGFIIFGILHFIGVSIILAHFFLKLRLWNLILGIIFILTGIFLQTMVFDFSWLLWLGLTPSTLYTFDYFPLLPWFGLVLIGMFFGNTLYPKGKARIKDRTNIITRPFCFLGRHSLLIYLIHQPILVALLYAFVL